MLSTLRTGLSARGLNAVKATAVIARSYSTPINGLLPEDMSEEEHLTYGEPVRIPATHNITVAHLHLRSYLPHELDFFTDFARRAAAVLEMPCSGAIPLPVQTSRWTVNKSPFIYKKAQENFERKTHKRLLAIKDTHPDVVRRWVQFLSQNSMAGVGMKVTIWEHEELGVGQKRFDKVKDGENKNRSVAESLTNAEEAFGTTEFEQMSGNMSQEPSKQIKAVADQLLAQMMKDIDEEEENSVSSNSTKNANSTTTLNPQEISPSPTATPDSSDQPTESNITDAVEPLVSGSATLNPELSKAVEKAMAETATTSVESVKSNKPDQ
ncbi:mitochondrial 37S ribosomal protein rsm10 [Modicella reniformis]|uniref:Small ribosomal subunit protein uS10m n=1 Tax=Modicella reniformis TaxID=1440133 RepID=A0A9P6M849_9FUNG|nr:mitochondrial 37S ribosomal protein rsm10 [Modicella reniformis]